MTACLPLQDCIVQTTRLPAYGRKFLQLRCSPANKANGLRPDNFTPLQWQFLKLHTSALQSLAVARYQNACTRPLLPCCSGKIPNCYLQWQDTKLHARGGCYPAAVAGYQTACRRRLLPCCSGRIPNCMSAWLPCCSVRLSNCFNA
jgi:hypothetical protein